MAEPKYPFDEDDQAILGIQSPDAVTKYQQLYAQKSSLQSDQNLSALLGLLDVIPLASGAADAIRARKPVLEAEKTVRIAQEAEKPTISGLEQARARRERAEQQLTVPRPKGSNAMRERSVAQYDFAKKNVATMDKVEELYRQTLRDQLQMEEADIDDWIAEHGYNLKVIKGHGKQGTRLSPDTFEDEKYNIPWERIKRLDITTPDGEIVPVDPEEWIGKDWNAVRGEYDQQFAQATQNLKEAGVQTGDIQLSELPGGRITQEGLREIEQARAFNEQVHSLAAQLNALQPADFYKNRRDQYGVFQQIAGKSPDEITEADLPELAKKIDAYRIRELEVLDRQEATLRNPEKLLAEGWIQNLDEVDEWRKDIERKRGALDFLARPDTILFTNTPQAMSSPYFSPLFTTSKPNIEPIRKTAEDFLSEPAQGLVWDTRRRKGLRPPLPDLAAASAISKGQRRLDEAAEAKLNWQRSADARSAAKARRMSAEQLAEVPAAEYAKAQMKARLPFVPLVGAGYEYMTATEQLGSVDQQMQDLYKSATPAEQKEIDKFLKAKDDERKRQAEKSRQASEQYGILVGGNP